MAYKLKIPYGDEYFEEEININGLSTRVFKPKISLETPQIKQKMIVENALENPFCDDGPANNFDFSEKSIAIAINDNTRPLPMQIIYPELIRFLIVHHAKPTEITFYVATGTHKSLSSSDYQSFLPKELIEKHTIVCHDCDDTGNLMFIGASSRNTPIFINKRFMEADYKLLIGQIEPHHFMGYSGGIKTAVIGLGGRDTIKQNHSMITDENAKMCLFDTNPMRNDIEEIGKALGIDAIFNVVLNQEKSIMWAGFGDADFVMRNGIQISDSFTHLNINRLYDVVIASPGGFPKDINLYQAQKAITHAKRFCKSGGTIILLADCRDGLGSISFENFLNEKRSIKDILSMFTDQPFEIGPHKAFQIAKQLIQHRIYLISSLSKEQTEKAHLSYARKIVDVLDQLKTNSGVQNVAILPYATYTTPNEIISS